MDTPIDDALDGLLKRWVDGRRLRADEAQAMRHALDGAMGAPGDSAVFGDWWLRFWQTLGQTLGQQREQTARLAGMALAGIDPPQSRRALLGSSLRVDSRRKGITHG